MWRKEEISGIRCQKVTFDDDEYSGIMVEHQKKMSERDGRALFESKLGRFMFSVSLFFSFFPLSFHKIKCLGNCFVSMKT